MPAKTDINKMGAKGWAPIAYQKKLSGTWWGLIKPIDEETHASWYWELYLGEPSGANLRATGASVFPNPTQAADDLITYLTSQLAQEGIV